MMALKLNHHLPMNDKVKDKKLNMRQTLYS